jgi:hypothetical protein
VLSDPAKRREYDSTDEFDDTLPTSCAAADFFKVSVGWGWLGGVCMASGPERKGVPDDGGQDGCNAAVLLRTRACTNVLGFCPRACQRPAARCLARLSAATRAGVWTAQCQTWAA